MPNRIIKSAAKSSSVQLSHCLRSLFTLELLRPSSSLYLISPWLSDVPVLVNRFGQLRSVMPDNGTVELGLAATLGLLAERGTTVRVITRPGQPSGDFLRKLSPQVDRRTIQTLHEKGLIGDHFYLRGSMNFTYSGVYLNDEHIELTTDPQTIALALMEAKQQWESLPS